jgi:L-fuconolactonase
MGAETPAVLMRDYLPADLAPHLAKHRIEKTVLVQAADTVAETDFLLDIAQQTDSVAGVVGWLDMESDFLAQFERYCQNPKFIGIRPMLQDLPDDDYILRPRVLAALKHVAERDFPFDILTYPRQLPYVLQALEQVPNLRGVVDHISKPNIREKQREPWYSDIAKVAAHPRIYCKLSGMITEADTQHWTAEDLRPYIEHVLDCFGAERVLFGSDWPVCLVAGSYDQVIGALETVLRPHLDATTERAVFGENAARFYKIA